MRTTAAIILLSIMVALKCSRVRQDEVRVPSSEQYAGVVDSCTQVPAKRLFGKWCRSEERAAVLASIRRIRGIKEGYLCESGNIAVEDYNWAFVCLTANGQVSYADSLHGDNIVLRNSDLTVEHVRSIAATAASNYHILDGNLYLFTEIGAHSLITLKYGLNWDTVEPIFHFSRTRGCPPR